MLYELLIFIATLNATGTGPKALWNWNRIFRIQVMAELEHESKKILWKDFKEGWSDGEGGLGCNSKQEALKIFRNRFFFSKLSIQQAFEESREDFCHAIRCTVSPWGCKRRLIERRVLL